MSIKLQVKKLAGDSLIYGLSGIINRFIGIFLIPIYTRIFTPADYGVINLVNTAYYFLGMVAVSGMDNSFFRWYYDKEDQPFRKQVTASWFWFQTVAMIVIAILAVIANVFFSKLIFGNTSNGIYFILGALVMFLSGFSNILTNWFRARQKAIATVSFSLLISLINIGLSILFVLILKKGLLGVFMALLIGAVISSLISIIILRDWVNYKYFNKSLCKEMLKYGIPLIPVAVAMWFLNSSASYFIQFMEGQYEVGLFSVGVSLGSGIYLLTGAFQQAWAPFAFSIINQEHAKNTYAGVLLVYTFITSLALCFLSFFGRDVLVLITQPNYYGADWVALLIGINYVLIGYIYIASLGIGIAKKNSPYAKIVSISAIITIGLFFVLIPMLGKEGAALSMIIGQTLIPIFLFKVSQKYYPIPYNFLVTLILFCLTLFLIFFGKYYLDKISIKYLFVLKIGVIFLWALFAYFLVVKNGLKNTLSSMNFKHSNKEG